MEAVKICAAYGVGCKGDTSPLGGFDLPPAFVHVWPQSLAELRRTRDKEPSLPMLRPLQGVVSLTLGYELEPIPTPGICGGLKL